MRAPRRFAPGWPGPDGICPPRISRQTTLMSTHASSHAYRSRTTHRNPRASGLGRRRRLLQSCDRAARDCLEKAQREAASVDVVISCSITKFRGGLTQWVEPTMSSAVAHAIGAEQAMTFDLSNACAGMLTGVTVANNWIRQGTDRTRLGGQRRVHLPTRPECGPPHPQHHEQRIRVTDPGRRGCGAPAGRAPAGSAGISWPASPPWPTTADFASVIRKATIRARECSPMPGGSSGRRCRTPRCCCTKSLTQPASRFTTSIT